MIQKISPYIKSFSIETESATIKEYLVRQGMVSIDLQLTFEEKRILQYFQIQTDGLEGNFLYWGNVNDGNLQSNFKSYLSTLGRNAETDIRSISNLIMRITKSATKYFDTNFAWIEAKTFLDNDTFITPRWHTDNKFFAPHTAYKFVWAAKGPQTRFGITKDPESFKELTIQEISAGHGTADNIHARKEIDQIVEEVSIPSAENAVLYRSGGENPVVHSEPHMNTSRLFIAVVPGSKEEVSEWHKRKIQKDVRKQVRGRKWSYCTI